MTWHTRPLAVFVLLSILMACTSTSSPENLAKEACPLTEAVWLKPAADSAVQPDPGYGYYYVNEDRSIIASAWWTDSDEYSLHAGDNGNKIGWFRPAGTELLITGQRLDGDAPPLVGEASCCYPTRFQASGVYFPTTGCWEVNATAADKKITFVVWVEP
jgi:hypothetical protein